MRSKVAEEILRSVFVILVLMAVLTWALVWTIDSVHAVTIVSCNENSRSATGPGGETCLDSGPYTCICTDDGHCLNYDPIVDCEEH
jgi:hypothetical protein